MDFMAGPAGPTFALQTWLPFWMAVILYFIHAGRRAFLLTMCGFSLGSTIRVLFVSLFLFGFFLSFVNENSRSITSK